MAVAHRTGDLKYNNRGSMRIMVGIPANNPGEMKYNNRGSMISYTQTAFTLSFTNSSPLPDGNNGSVYPTQTITATGGLAPYTYAVTAGTLPTGLTLSSGGSLSGTCSAAGVFNFTITATDAEGGGGNTGSKAFQITVSATIVVTTASPMPDGVNGVAYNQTLASTGGTAPITWSVTAGSLPTGLTLHSATGVIDGTPTVNAVYNFTVTATDADTYTGAKAMQITVAGGGGGGTTGGDSGTGMGGYRLSIGTGIYM